MTSISDDKKYKGVRRRKWGKWVSEIRVPGSQERLWLGSYSSPEAAAVAHDVAYYCLRRPSTMEQLNFPPMMLPYLRNNLIVREDMSPGSIQKAASDAAMAVDAQYIISNNTTTDVVHGSEYNNNNNIQYWGSGTGSGEQHHEENHALSVSIEDYM